MRGERNQGNTGVTPRYLLSIIAELWHTSKWVHHDRSSTGDGQQTPGFQSEAGHQFTGELQVNVNKGGKFSYDVLSVQDNVVTAMYASTGTEQKMAEEVLTTLKEHPDAWTKVDTILEFSNNQQTKYYALQILEQVIKTRWKVLPRNQCEGIKK